MTSPEADQIVTGVGAPSQDGLDTDTFGGSMEMSGEAITAKTGDKEEVKVNEKGEMIIKPGFKLDPVTGEQVKMSEIEAKRKSTQLLLEKTIARI